MARIYIIRMAILEIKDVKEWIQDKIDSWKSEIKEPEGYHIESNTFYRRRISDYEQVLELLDCVKA